MLWENEFPLKVLAELFSRPGEGLGSLHLLPSSNANLEGTRGDKMYLCIDSLQKLLHFRAGHGLQLLYPAMGQEEAPQGLAVVLLQIKKSPGQISGRRGGAR